MLKGKGIYAIYNTISQKVYVGQTQSTFIARWSQHKHRLKKNTHPNKHLQSAWNLYSTDVFEFSILESIESTQLNTYFAEREEYWKCYLERCGISTYNLMPVGISIKGYKHTEENNKKNRERVIQGYKNHPEIRLKQAERKQKTWPSFIDDGGIVYTVTNLAKFCRERNIDRGNMARMLGNKVHYHSTYGFRLLERII